MTGSPPPAPPAPPTRRGAAPGASAPRTRAVRRRTPGPGLGPFPLLHVVLVELGLAVSLLLVGIDRTWWPAAVAVLLVVIVVVNLRWHGLWVSRWGAIAVGYAARSHSRTVDPGAGPADVADLDRNPGLPGTLTGGEDARVGLARLLVEDLVIASRTDHGGNPIGLAWHEGTWTAVVLLEPVPPMVAPVGTRVDVPLTDLAGCLRDRGVVLDGIGVVWHSYPGGTTLAPDAPALVAYHEVLGPLPAVARRSTWVAVRLDPRRCPDAVHERGGGVAGAHRALLGAVSRVCGVLDAAGLNSRVLDTDELLRSIISCAELSSFAGRDETVGLHERWRGVTSAEVEHCTYALRGWRQEARGLDRLTGVRALSTTVAMALGPVEPDGRVGMRGLLRLCAHSPVELSQAQALLARRAARSGLRLTPLNGQQAAGVAATLPIGGT